MVTYLRTQIHQITGRDIPIAFSEVNSDSSGVVGGVASPDSYYNAIWYADVLGRLIEQNVFMVNQWAHRRTRADWDCFPPIPSGQPIMFSRCTTNLGASGYSVHQG